MGRFETQDLMYSRNYPMAVHLKSFNIWPDIATEWRSPITVSWMLKRNKYLLNIKTTVMARKRYWRYLLPNLSIDFCFMFYPKVSVKSVITAFYPIAQEVRGCSRSCPFSNVECRSQSKCR